MTDETNNLSLENFSLEELKKIIHERACSVDENSYTHLLCSKGSAECSKKLGEEAVEVVIAAMRGNKNEIINETADLLYHLLVVLEVSQVEFTDVLQELAKRTGQSGISEKLSRNQGN